MTAYKMLSLLLVLLIHVSVTVGYINPCNTNMCDPDQSKLYDQLTRAGLHPVKDLSWVIDGWFKYSGSAMHLTEAMSWKAMILGYGIDSGSSNSICQTACMPRGGNAYCEGRDSSQWCTLPFHGQYGVPLWWFGKLYKGYAWGKIREDYSSWQYSLHHMCSSNPTHTPLSATDTTDPVKIRPNTTICFLGNHNPMAMKANGWYRPTPADQEDEDEWTHARSQLWQKWFTWAEYSDEQFAKTPLGFQCVNNFFNNFTCRWYSAISPETQCTLNITVNKVSDYIGNAPMPHDPGHPHRRTVSVHYTSKLGVITSAAKIREVVYCDGKPMVEINERGRTSAVKPYPPKNLTVVWVQGGVNISWVGDPTYRPYFRNKEFEAQYKNVHDDWEKAQSAIFISEYSFLLPSDRMQAGQKYVARVRMRYDRPADSTGENLWSEWSDEIRWSYMVVT